MRICVGKGGRRAVAGNLAVTVASADCQYPATVVSVVFANVNGKAFCAVARNSKAAVCVLAGWAVAKGNGSSEAAVCLVAGWALAKGRGSGH